MFVTPLHCAETTSDSAPESTGDRRLRILRELTDIGISVARVLGAQIVRAGEAAIASAARNQDADPGQPPAPPPGQAETTLALSRISRAVRQSVALEQRLEQQPAAPLGRPAILQSRLLRRTGQIRREIGKVIETQAAPADAESLLLDLDERLDDPELAERIAIRPVSEIIARIRYDLGISPAPCEMTDAELKTHIAFADEDEAEAEEDDFPYPPSPRTPQPPPHSAEAPTHPPPNSPPR